MLLENIASSATNQNIGIQLLKNVLSANQDTLGMLILTNAHAANFQDKSSMEYAHVNTQKLNGNQSANNASAHQILSVTIANHAQHQEFGIGV